jgi:hypothetical protein
MSVSCAKAYFESTVCDKLHLWKRRQDFCPERRRERKKEGKETTRASPYIEAHLKTQKCFDTVIRRRLQNCAAHNSAWWQESLFHDYFRFLYVETMIFMLIFFWVFLFWANSSLNLSTYAVMRHLTTGVRSEKWVVRRFRRCAKVIECTYTNLDSIAYCTPRLYGIAYCS